MDQTGAITCCTAGGYDIINHKPADKGRKPCMHRPDGPQLFIHAITQFDPISCLLWSAHHHLIHIQN